MKQLSLLILLLIFIGCTPVKYVNVERKHNYYHRHRHNTYTIPTWVPNVGVVLQTHIYRSKPIIKNNNPRRKKH
jgi:hypothetical protein